MFLSDGGPSLEMLDFALYIGMKIYFSYFDFYLNIPLANVTDTSRICFNAHETMAPRVIWKIVPEFFFSNITRGELNKQNHMIILICYISMAKLRLSPYFENAGLCC